VRTPALKASAALLLATCLAAPAAAAERIVSLGGGVTETVYALGAGRQLAGVDLTSLYPPAATRLPQVGYLRTLSAEGLLSLHPDLVLAAPEAGPPEALAQAEAAGLAIERLAAGYTIEATLARVAAVGAAIGRPAEAAALAAAMRADLAAVAAELATVRSRPRVLFLLQVGRGAPLASGRGTAADAMIALAGGENALGQSFAGYQPLATEWAVAAAPDLLLLTSESVVALGGRAAVLALPELAAMRGAAGRRLVDLEALYLLGFGPRLPQAVRDLAAALHPEHAFPPLPAHPWTTAAP
jgi:iron complex transport system substrate-binding protein